MAMSSEPRLGVEPRAGISWAAAFAGAAVATAVTVMLLALGAGIGFGSISPRAPGGNPTVATFTALAAAWLVVVQWLSSALGGYVAGRLRPHSGSLHGSETSFRDTATGLVAWSVATVVVVAAVTAGVTGAVGQAARGAGTAANTPAPYLMATLFRPATQAAADPRLTTSTFLAREEAGTIFANAGPTVQLGASDRDYLVGLVAAHTGATADEATRRVDLAVAADRTALNDARRAASGFSLFSFFSMLVGAFVAAVAAAIGGRQRDMI